MAKINPLIKSRLKKAENCLTNNDYPAAIALYEQVIKAGFRDPGILCRLGTLFRFQGEYDRAIYYGELAIELAPGDAFAHHTLGSTLQSQNKFEEAVRYYKKAIHLDPKLTEAQYYLANALRENGDLEEAVPAYENLLLLAPDHFEGLNNFGALLTNIAQAKKAIGILVHALELHPDSVETLTNLGRAHVMIGAQTSAMELLDKALDLQPDFVDARIEMAWAQRLDGRYADSMNNFSKALELSEDNERAMIGKAIILEIQAKYPEAYTLLEPLLDSESTSAICAFFDISKHINQRDKAVSLITKQLASETLNTSGSSPLHFRLGKHYDREKDFNTAIEHFHIANQQSQREFDIGTTKTQFSAICDAYDAAALNSIVQSDCKSLLPVFIIGMPRSGTSLVESIIASHPQVHGAGETSNVSDTCDRFSAASANKDFPHFIQTLTKDALNDVANNFLADLVQLSSTATRITDKMPHNFLYFGLMLQLFPDCKIIHCERNMLDTCLSCYFSAFGSNYHDYAYDLTTLGQYYGLYSMLMTHWQSIYPNRIYHIKYENLVEHQERESRALLAHCELEWDDNCLNFHQLDRVINTISYDQVRQPIYRQSTNRWKNYDAHLEPLRNGLVMGGIPSDEIPG